MKTSEQMTAFDALAHFGARFGHMGRLSSLRITGNMTTVIKLTEKKIIDGNLFEREVEIDLQNEPHNEHVLTERYPNQTLHEVSKLYGKYNLWALFAEDKKGE